MPLRLDILEHKARHEYWCALERRTFSLLTLFFLLSITEGGSLGALKQNTQHLHG